MGNSPVNRKIQCSGEQWSSLSFQVCQGPQWQNAIGLDDKNPMLRNAGEVVFQEELDKVIIEGDAEAVLYSVGGPQKAHSWEIAQFVQDVRHCCR